MFIAAKPLMPRQLRRSEMFQRVIGKYTFRSSGALYIL